MAQYYKTVAFFALYTICINLFLLKLQPDRFDNHIYHNISLSFISQNPEFGSSTMRGRNFINEWGRRNSPFILTNEVASCTSHQCADICVFIGPCPHGYPPCCKVKVLDIIDKYLFHKKIIDKQIHEFDALVVNNNYMKTYFQEIGFGGEILILFHHSDPRWFSVKSISSEKSTLTQSLRFGYIGSIPSLKHTDNFMHRIHLQKRYPITLVDTDQGHIPSLVDFQMDISIRPLHSDTSRFKTSAKISTAAALGHNIITTLEESVKDCLPTDYPFLIKDTSLKEVSIMFDLASKDYAGSQYLWKKGLSMMKELNETLTLSAIASEYEFFLIRLLPEEVTGS